MKYVWLFIKRIAACFKAAFLCARHYRHVLYFNFPPRVGFPPHSSATRSHISW